MSSNKPIQGIIGPDGAKVPYPLQPGQQVTANLTLNQPCDVMLVLTCDGIDKAFDEGSGPSLWRSIKEPVAIEMTGAWVFEIRRYSESDAPVGVGWALRVEVTATPVYTPIKRALAIGLAEEWAAKLQNIHDEQGGKPISNAIGVYATSKYDIGAADLSRFDLVIIGHNEVRWHDNGDTDRIRRLLLTKPLLLQGLGGQRFAEQAGLIERGMVWNGESQIGTGSILSDVPLWNAPYPLNWPSDGELKFYHDFTPVYGVSGWYGIGVDIRTFVSTRYGTVDSVFQFTGKNIWYFGYPAIPDAWELWGLWCNIAWSLAVQK